MLSLWLGDPCDAAGNTLPQDTVPMPHHNTSNSDWSPFKDQSQFLLADFLFRKNQMSASDIDYLMQLWALDMAKHDNSSPFAGHDELYQTLDSIKVGDAPWKCLSVNSQGASDANAPSWKEQEYQVWYHDPDTLIQNMLDNPDFKDQFDIAPYIQTDKTGKRWWTNFMSGNFSWRHSVSSA